MNSLTFLNGRDEIVSQNLDLVGSGSLVVIPMSDSYSPDVSGQDVIADVSADELSATGYDGGFGGADRRTPTGRVLRRDNANNRLEFDFDDLTFPDIGGNVNQTNDVVTGYIIAEERTSDSDSPIVGFLDLADNRPTNGSDITVSPDAEGALQFD
jgi:hypothetical protein